MPRVAALALALICAATLVACGGSGSSSSGSGSSAGANAAGANSAAADKFRSCLKAQGVDVPPGPGAGGGGGAGGGYGQRPQRTPAQQKAMQACAKYRPQGGGFGGGGGGGAQNIAAFKPYLQCLKDQGLAIDINAGFQALRGLKRDDPKLQPALKACASKLPQRPQGAPPASATPSTTTTT